VSAPASGDRPSARADLAGSAQRALPATLAERYALVRERIAAAAARSGRSGEQIILVAVTKNAEAEQIRELLTLGHQDLGESRAQILEQHAVMIEEWQARQKMLPGVGSGSGPAPAKPRWHMIGHLQRNKVKKVLPIARLVHSVDSLRLVEEIQAFAARRERRAVEPVPPVEVLLQVNCSGEQSKFGCAVPAAMHLADQIDTMVQVKLRGLMTMAPAEALPAQVRATFGRCHELFVEMREEGLGGNHFNILSMGMSNDFEVAIEEGANLVRVGTALFGPSKRIDDEDAEEDVEPTESDDLDL
jgi:pyridoxal phosphate enzyme (YggS family)